MPTKKIILTSDEHIDDYSATQSDIWINQVVPDINAVNPDLVISTGDSGGSIYWNFDEVKAKMDLLTAPLIKIDGNHPWDQYGYLIPDKNGVGVVWWTNFPYVESTLSQPITSTNQLRIKPSSLVGFSSSETRIVVHDKNTKVTKLSYVQSIDQTTGEIVLTQGFGATFTDLTNTIVMQGRDRVGLKSLIADFLMDEPNAERLSQTYLMGNNLFILLSVEDYYETLPTYGRASLSTSALVWFEETLAANQDKNIFVDCHYAVAGSGITMTDGLGVTGTGLAGVNSFGLSDASSQAIKDLLVQYKVCAWFSGHAHLHPMESGVIQSNTPVGYGGCTFVHLPSTTAQGPTWYQTTTIKPWWRMLELTKGESTALIKTRDSDLQQWIPEQYNINLTLTYSVFFDTILSTPAITCQDSQITTTSQIDGLFAGETPTFFYDTTIPTGASPQMPTVTDLGNGSWQSEADFTGITGLYYFSVGVERDGEWYLSTPFFYNFSQPEFTIPRQFPLRFNAVELPYFIVKSSSDTRRKVAAETLASFDTKRIVISRIVAKASFDTKRIVTVTQTLNFDTLRRVSIVGFVERGILSKPFIERGI